MRPFTVIFLFCLISSFALAQQQHEVRVKDKPSGISDQIYEPGLSTPKPAYDRVESAISQFLSIYDTQGIESARAFSAVHGITIQKESVLLELSFEENYVPEDVPLEKFLQHDIEIDSRSDHFLIVWIPVREVIDFLKDVSLINLAHRPLQADAGITTEGLSMIGADSFHDREITGEGVSIGVFDSGFGQSSEAQDRDELPEFTFRNFTNEALDEGSIHGTACAEIIYDIAPDADLHLIKIWNTAHFENALEYALENEIDVISMSIGWLMPLGDYYRGEDQLSELVNDAYNEGLFIVESAGNNAHATYRADFDDEDAEDQYHRFPGGETVNHFGPDEEHLYDLEEGTDLSITLVWDDFPQTDQDFDLELVHLVNDEWQVVDRANNRQNGNDLPRESISFSTDEAGAYGIRILRYEADNGMDFTLISYPQDLAYNTPDGSIIIPAIAEGCFTVGAVYHEEWDDNNVAVEPFSSRGPTYDGRIKPDIAAPDGVSTFAYGQNESPFFGTSAACPHVAGAAGLVLAGNPQFTNAEIREYIIANAVDAGEEGRDNSFGYGLLNIESVPFVFEGLFINELQADNDNTTRDPQGDFEDWVELYNSTGADIDMADFYLTDDLNNPDRWRFPEDAIIEAHGFLMIWADGDIGDAGLHTIFSLNQAGEAVGLYYDNGELSGWADRMVFDQQQADWSYGRESDGAENWVEFETPTPGESNQGEQEEPEDEWMLFDDGRPATLYTDGNYWSKVVFTANQNLQLQAIEFMPFNPAPNFDDPCRVLVYRTDDDWNLTELVWETEVEQLDAFNFDNIEENWIAIAIAIADEERPSFNEGESFTVMYGPAPGGDYDPGNMQEGDGWWNLTDGDTEVNRSFLATGDDPRADHRDWSDLDADLLLRASIIPVPSAPRILTDPENGSEIFVELLVDDDPVERTISIFNSAEQDAEDLDFEITVQNGGWVSVEPLAGQISPGEEQRIHLTFNPQGLDAGSVHQAQLNLMSNDPENPELSFDLRLEIHANDRELRVNFESGWSLMSINVAPGRQFFGDGEERGPDVMLMTEQFRIDEDHHNLLLIKDGAGQFYSPAWGFNNIPYWNQTHAYQMNLAEAEEAVWTGEPIDPQIEIPLSNGWNMIAYLPTYQLSVSAPNYDAIADILDHVEIMKNGAGEFLVPDFNFSNMPPLRESQGYQIKVDEDLAFHYPEAAEEMLMGAIGNSFSLESNPASENMSLLIEEFMGLDSDDIDQIFARTVEGKVVGQGSVNEQGQCGIAVWGDDPLTDEFEGLQKGESFELWARLAQSPGEARLRIDDFLLGSELNYQTDELIVVKAGLKQSVPDEYSLGETYPNPFNSKVTISYGLPVEGVVNVGIYSVNGRIAEELVNEVQRAGHHSAVWNAEGFSSGIYFVRMSAQGFSDTGKLILVR